jgi:hypothetical protein
MRTSKLEDYIATGPVHRLEKIDLALLECQLASMQSLQHVLDMRLSRIAR